MRVDVVMPQMGESIAEGTITRWIKKVGETVDRDEPVFEISTDKVDAEIPSPAQGTLVEIRSQEGDTIPVNEVVAVIETEAGAAASAEQKPAAAPTEAAAPAPQAAPPTPAPSPAAAPAPTPIDDTRFVSPVVRNIAAQHGIDPAAVAGTGAGGRVTKKDIEAFIKQGGASAAPVAPATPAAPSRPPVPAVGPAPPSFGSGERTLREPMSVMRKRIAQHMIDSRRTSAHVQSVFEVDMTHIARSRQKYKPTYIERHGANLTYLPFVIKAVTLGLREWPIINSSVEGEDIVYKRDLNIGIAVALDWGLIVPVLHNADDLSIAGLAKRAADLGHRARTKQLNPDEVQGGTFTITNPGQFGGLYGLPIINQPQVAILGMGGIKKRPVVIDDGIAIRSMMYMTMSYDHRVVDGAVADQFLALVQRTLEEFDEAFRQAPLLVRWLGRVRYDDAQGLQAELVKARRRQEIVDTLLLLEHPPVITLGRGASEDNVVVEDDDLARLGIEKYEVGRGGDVTFHGPGQLVGYPIIALGDERRDAHRYLRDLEQALIRTCAHFGVHGFREPGLTGVWVGTEAPAAKVAAIGVRLSSGWITSHGFALNVSTDLAGFETIVPCGIGNRGVTSLGRILGRAPDLQEVAALAAGELASVFHLRPTQPAARDEQLAVPPRGGLSWSPGDNDTGESS